MTLKPALWTLALTTLLALSGCSGGGGGGDGDGSSTPPTSGPSGTSGPPTTTSPGPQPPAAPLYINGTVQGVYDCTNPGLPPLGLDTSPVPMEAWNRTYALTLVSGTQSPAGGMLCLVWDTGDMGNSGTVPSGATSVTVAADFTYDGAYSIRID